MTNKVSESSPITIKEEFNKIFPAIIIFLGTVIIYLCIYKDFVRVGFNLNWILIRLMYLPFVLVVWKLSKIALIQSSRFYELPLWLAGIYITLFCAYFSFSTGGLKSDYALGLIQFYFVLSVMPLTVITFYGLSIISLIIYIALNVFEFGTAPLHNQIAITAMLPLLIFSPIVYIITSHIRSAKLAYQNRLADILRSRDEVIITQSRKLADVETKAAVGLMVAQMAHDIRSPIATLNMITSGLIEFTDQYIPVIRDATGRINDIANDLLKRFSGKENEGFSRYSINVINEEIGKIITEKKFQFKDKSVSFLLSLIEGKSDVYVELNISDFLRVISNLINNSVEAFKNTGIVKIITSLNVDYFHIEVIDNGVGMTKAQLDNAFVQGVTTKLEGCGLGLFHAKSIINSLNGLIEITSEVNVGTRVSIRMPLTLS